MKDVYKYIWIVPIFILAQVLFLNNINLGGYINPLLYLVLIITLPQDTEKWFLITFAFIIGLLLDLFEGNMGLNSSSLVFIAFIKPYLEQILIPKNSIEEKEKLNLQTLGIRIFSAFSFSLIFMHSSFLFLLDYFNTLDVFVILIKIILSSFTTYIVILILQLFTYKTKE